MPTRLGFFGAKRRTKCVDQTERGRRRFPVQLACLREVRRSLLEVGRLEQSAALPDCRRENRRVDAKKAALIEEIMDRLLDLVPHHENRALLRAAEPEMPVVE